MSNARWKSADRFPCRFFIVIADQSLLLETIWKGSRDGIILSELPWLSLVSSISQDELFMQHLVKGYVERLFEAFDKQLAPFIDLVTIGSDATLSI